jgi:Pentapeptide repeats (9 copies)
MPRGLYWQAMFDPKGLPPTEEVDLAVLRDSVGPVAKIIKGAVRKPKFERKEFRACDFPQRYERLTFVDGTFEQCCFDSGSDWDHVKFTRCQFHHCHFGMVTFSNCIFLDCLFDDITISAEHNAFVSTSISAAQFLGAATSNVKHLPPGKTAEDQLFRLKGSVAKLAHTLVASSRDEPDSDLFFEAHKEFIVRQLAWKFANARSTSSGTRHHAAATFLLRLPIALELALVYSGGWLTSWGRSVARPIAFFAFISTGFAVLYHWSFGLPLGVSTLKALDVSLVAGYTKYKGQSNFEEVAQLVNMVLGVYWYSLVVPVLTRKTIR